MISSTSTGIGTFIQRLTCAAFLEKARFIEITRSPYRDPDSHYGYFDPIRSDSPLHPRNVPNTGRRANLSVKHFLEIDVQGNEYGCLEAHKLVLALFTLMRR